MGGNYHLAQMVKHLPTMQEARVQSLGREDLEKEMATHSSILAWRILWTEEPGGLLCMGSHRVRHNWSDLACMHALEKEMATHSSVLAWRIPGTGEPDGLLSMGSHRIRHDWSDLAAAAAATGWWFKNLNHSSGSTNLESVCLRSARSHHLPLGLAG